MAKRGLIQVYTGSGKGKSTASIGLAFRAIGRNYKVLIVQFLKGDKHTDRSYGELITAETFKDNLKIIQSYDDYKITTDENKTKEDERLTLQTWATMCCEAESGKYDLIVLDEVLVALCLGFISWARFSVFIKELRQKYPELELVFTGRIWNDSIYDKVKDLADYMSDIRAVKHPFNKHCPKCKREFEYRSNYCPNCGTPLITIPARRGIEF